MKKRRINKVAVLGSGIMGSRIACHFANIGVEVLLLDIVPNGLTEKEEAKGLTLEDTAVRNRIVNESLQTALKSNPSPIYSKSFASNIKTGNFDDDLHRIKDCDWVMEVIVERLDIKQSLFEKVEQHRTPGTLITSNTSGIPIHMMSEGRSEDFQKHFCGTHFFNPPRYLKLLEIIPGPQTEPEVLEFLMDYGKRFLGKTTVWCKDTPAFIANRIGVFSIMWLFHHVKEKGYTVDEIDKLTGPVIGRPKSATFRTTDVVGLDTLVHVANGVKKNVADDEMSDQFQIPAFIQSMVENKMLGDKTKQGFFKKTKDDKGNREILVLNLDSLEYESRTKPKFASLEAAKGIDDLGDRIKFLYNFKDKAGEFYRAHFSSIFAYVANRIPEVSDEIYRLDDAMMAGFGYEIGPFEAWDAIGLEQGLKELQEQGFKTAAWMTKMVELGGKSFYRIHDGKRQFWDQSSESYTDMPGQDGTVSLMIAKHQNVLWKNSGTTITDLGDGILNVEFHTKMNTIGGDVLQGLNKAIDMAESDYEGVVVYNEGGNFSAGANVGLIFMMAAEQEYDELDFAIRQFQNTVMRMRYSSIPVVSAPHNLALGGACELSMHADKVVANAELYMGLVEFGVGVIPGGGGTKEFAVRLSDELRDGDIRTNQFRHRLMTIAQAKVATSAHEAFELGYLRKGIDEVVVSRELQLTQAKKAALDLAEKGYTKPIERNDIQVLGNEGLGLVYVGAETMTAGNYMSEHDRLISEKLGWAMSGGDLSYPQKVSERYLLDLERKAFLELCATRPTLERLQSMVKYGKVLRN